MGLETTAQIDMAEGSPRLSPRRTELLNWFRKRAVSLAHSYEGAIKLIEDRNFPGRIHFIAHAIRDIADRLPFALDPQEDGRRVQYESEMDAIEKKWLSPQALDSTAELAIADSVNIPYDLALRIDGLIKAHRDRRRRPSNSELLFRHLMRNDSSRADVNERLVRDFKSIRGWFMHLTHLRRESPPDVDENDLQSKFAAFESMLHSFVGDFFTGALKLDEILQQANQ